MRGVVIAFILIAGGFSGRPAAAAETGLDAVARLTGATAVIGQIKQIPDLAAYANDPKVVCTGFLPTNEGAAAAFRDMGRYIGLFATDEQMQAEIMNYHVVPGKHLMPDDLKDGTVLITREYKEPVKISRKGDKIQLISTPDFVANLTSAKPIKTPSCLVYTIDDILAPPSRAPLVLEYRRKAEADKAAKDGAAAAEAAATPSSPVAGGVALPAASPATAAPRSAAAVLPAVTGMAALAAAGAGGVLLML